MSLYTEIKRRKVVRVATVYAATAFVVLQAADIMLPRLGVLDWAVSLVVALAVLGLSIAVVALLLAVGAGLGTGLILAPRTTVEPGDVMGAGATPDRAASAAAFDRSVAVLPFACPTALLGPAGDALR